MNVEGRAPAIHYAKSGGLNIAFSVTGEGPDLVVAPGFISHLDIMWEEPSVVHFYSRLATFRRVITFDKRGTGLSDPAMHAPTLEESIDDLGAVMDAAGCERADLVGISEGGTMAILMTASHPDRVKALVLYGTFTRLLRAPDYPLGVTEEQLSALVEVSAKGWGEGVGLGAWAPSRRGDADLRRWWARLQRVAASPGMVRNIFALYPQLDIRDVLPAIQVPTLVLHRRADRMVSIEMGRYLADRIPGAKFVELDGRRPPVLHGRRRHLARRDRGVPHRRPAAACGRARPGHRAVHRHRRLHEASGRARRRAMEGAARQARRPGPAPARAIPRS